MSTVLNNLFERLEQLLGLHQQLHAVLQQQQTAMRRGDLKLLERNQVAGRALVNRITTVEQHRRSLLLKLSRSLGLSELSTSSALAEKLNEPARGRLAGLIARLRSLTEQIKRANNVLAQVSRRVSQQMQGVVELITSAGSDAGLYARSGRRARSSGQRLLDAVA